MAHPHSVEIESVLGSLSDSIHIFAGFLRSIPADALEKKRGEDFWTVHEHADHLASVQSMVLERMQRILSEDVPEFVPYVPSEDDVVEDRPLRGVDEIIAEFGKVREAQLELLNGAGPEEWQRRAVHPEYAQYGLFMLARHVLMHDHWHMYRMEELWLTRDDYLTRLEG